MKIAKLVAQRTDLSTFVVHLTRDGENGVTAKEQLRAILSAQRLEARTPFGQARERLEGEADRDSQKVVCFTETPLEHISLLMEDIEGRQITLAPYGIALPKLVARRLGVNPVWYVDISPGHDWLTGPLNRMVDEALAAGDFHDSDIAKITPYIEQMGTRRGHYRKEFWWEREWRNVGNLDLPRRVIGIAPQEYFEELERVADSSGIEVAWIDPTWGLEEIIGHLARFERADIGVFE